MNCVTGIFHHCFKSPHASPCIVSSPSLSNFEEPYRPNGGGMQSAMFLTPVGNPGYSLCVAQSQTMFENQGLVTEAKQYLR